MTGKCAFGSNFLQVVTSRLPPIVASACSYYVSRSILIKNWQGPVCAWYGYCVTFWLWPQCFSTFKVSSSRAPLGNKCFTRRSAAPDSKHMPCSSRRERLRNDVMRRSATKIGFFPSRNDSSDVSRGPGNGSSGQQQFPFEVPLTLTDTSMRLWPRWESSRRTMILSSLSRPDVLSVTSMAMRTRFTNDRCFLGNGNTVLFRQEV